SAPQATSPRNETASVTAVAARDARREGFGGASCVMRRAILSAPARRRGLVPCADGRGGRHLRGRPLVEHEGPDSFGPPLGRGGRGAASGRGGLRGQREPGRDGRGGARGAPRRPRDRERGEPGLCPREQRCAAGPKGALRLLLE